MTTVETRVVHPVNRASVDSVNVTESELVDAEMRREEDRMLVDEEISSTEGLDYENQMLTVALVKSVVDVTPNSENKECSPTRYGLRKRRRTGDSGSEHDETIDHSQQPQDSEVHLGTERSLPSSSVLETNVEKGNGPQETPKPQQIAIKPTQEPSAKDKGISRHAPLMIQEDAGASRGLKIDDHPILGKLKANIGAPIVAGAIPPAVIPMMSLTTSAKKTPSPPKRKVKRPVKARGAAAKQDIFITSGAVPNPLSQVNVTPSAIPRPYEPRPTVEPRERHTGTTVPCPLPSSVPCPLQPELSEVPLEKKRVTISEPPAPQPQSRPRIFSVDLDREFCSSTSPLNVIGD
eukprot:scaffold925_cov129-Cylindrotheca_fusiformis.AAC.16